MATRKTTSPSGKTKTGSAKPKAAPAKSEPVILDPPAKKKPATVKKQAVVIDAKAEDVTKPEPVKKTEAPKAKANPEPAKSPESVTAKPQTSNSTRAFAGFLAGGAVAALIGYFAAGYINPAPVMPDNSGEIAALAADYNAKITALEAQIAK
ncbi:MAG: hypothetical protein GXP03_13755, partial [Alphaproteobacteria bacterium]|nr:hypothetical protein [Alphaproteobacteria bacterium]